MVRVHLRLWGCGVPADREAFLRMRTVGDWRGLRPTGAWEFVVEDGGRWVYAVENEGAAAVQVELEMVLSVVVEEVIYSGKELGRNIESKGGT